MKSFIIKLLPYDKLLHLVGGIYIYLISTIFVDGLISLFIALTIAILIEAVYDGLMEQGEPEILDVFYTMVGAVSVHLLLLLI